LILQRLRARRHDDLAAVEKRGNEVGERLAGTGAGLRDERCALGDRARDGVGHRELLRAQPESGEGPGQRAALAEDGGKRGIGRVARAIREIEDSVGQRLPFLLAAGAAAGAGVVRDLTTSMISLMPAMRSLKRS